VERGKEGEKVSCAVQVHGMGTYIEAYEYIYNETSRSIERTKLILECLHFRYNEISKLIGG
jgi:hypothetical protein